eukprot:scaffold614961_cov20-Prasinocladus_malaysianus.AAC.1
MQAKELGPGRLRGPLESSTRSSESSSSGWNYPSAADNRTPYIKVPLPAPAVTSTPVMMTMMVLVDPSFYIVEGSHNYRAELLSLR